MLKQVQPVLPSQNVSAAVDFYVQKLGFTCHRLVLEHPAYAVIQRDGVEIHLQWHDPAEWAVGDRPMLRFLVSDLQSLFREFSTAGVLHEGMILRETPWGTREFAFYDLDRNGLTFYVGL
jgi:uncharacterized glyoxalase superfamily protein PhnB